MPAVVPTLLIFPIKLPPSPQYAAAAPQEMMQHLLTGSHNGQNKNPAQGGNCNNERPQNVVYWWLRLLWWVNWLFGPLWAEELSFGIY
jgi:hypothetical protein